MKMQIDFDINEHPHRRKNILTGEWILVSPQRGKRPWLGMQEVIDTEVKISYDKDCYLCPTNIRVGGEVNPNYSGPYSFTNDHAALIENVREGYINKNDLLIVESQKGICKVICFSPKHNAGLSELSVDEITVVIEFWIKEFTLLLQNEWIKYIQLFENKGQIMGCSNPHPHSQIWSNSIIPVEIEKETIQLKQYYQLHKKSLLSDYLNLEIELQERILINSEHFVVLVPFWAVWPFETMIVCKRHIQDISQFSNSEIKDFANVIKKLSLAYDQLFNCSFPYSAGMHQQPVNDGEHIEWHWHMHFFPPLLRSATVKKFMVGYEMLANAQRDITPEQAAKQLRNTMKN